MTDVATGQVPSAGDQGSQGAQHDAVGAQGQEPERFDAEYVKKLRVEAAGYRTRLKELEQKVSEYEAAKLSETEKLQRRLAELEREQAEYQRERQEQLLRYETMLTANKLGIVDPEAAYRLLDISSVEFEQDGTPKNIEGVLKDMIAKRPYLAGSAGGSPTNPARSAGSPTVFTRSQLRDTKFFQTHRDAIMQAAREGRIIEE